MNIEIGNNSYFLHDLSRYQHTDQQHPDRFKKTLLLRSTTTPDLTSQRRKAGNVDTAPPATTPLEAPVFFLLYPSRLISAVSMQTC
jgi:hypothetical protein